MYLRDKTIDFTPDTKPLTQTQRNLLAAADYIQKNGWCWDTFENDEGNVCIRGALNAVRFGNPVGYHSEAEESAVARFLAPACHSNWQTDGVAIAEWNNCSAQNAEQVIAVLVGAANMATE